MVRRYWAIPQSVCRTHHSLLLPPVVLIARRLFPSTLFGLHGDADFTDTERAALIGGLRRYLEMATGTETTTGDGTPPCSTSSPSRRGRAPPGPRWPVDTARFRSQSSQGHRPSAFGHERLGSRVPVLPVPTARRWMQRLCSSIVARGRPAPPCTAAPGLFAPRDGGKRCES